MYQAVLNAILGPTSITKLPSSSDTSSIDCSVVRSLSNVSVDDNDNGGDDGDDDDDDDDDDDNDDDDDDIHLTTTIIVYSFPPEIGCFGHH